jgi:hypothetical protein
MHGFLLLLFKKEICHCRVQKKAEKSIVSVNKEVETTVNPLLLATKEESQADEAVEEEEEAMPVPQVKIGPDGSLIINEER